MKRCDGPWAGVGRWRSVMFMREVWEGVTVDRRCDSPKEVGQSVGRCNGHGVK